MIKFPAVENKQNKPKKIVLYVLAQDMSKRMCYIGTDLKTSGSRKFCSDISVNFLGKSRLWRHCRLNPSSLWF